MAINKREAILKSTLDLLAAKGFHGFSIKQVAERAGVAAGTVYLYFKDREDLIRRLRQELVINIFLELDEKHNDALSLKDQYFQMSRNLCEIFNREPGWLLTKSQFDHLPYDTHCEHIQEVLHNSSLRKLFDIGRQSGEIKDLPDEVIEVLAFGPLMDLQQRAIRANVPMSESLVQEILKSSWDAIRKH